MSSNKPAGKYFNLFSTLRKGVERDHNSSVGAAMFKSVFGMCREIPEIQLEKINKSQIENNRDYRNHLRSQDVSRMLMRAL